MQFDLPANATPTSLEFGHDNKITMWKISAKLDLPFATDESCDADVFVEGL